MNVGLRDDGTETIMQRFSIPCLLLMFAMTANTAAQEQSQTQTAQAQATITLNFVDTEIREVASSIGEITGKNFILDPRVKGRVTLVSARPIEIGAVYDTFLSVLQVHNFAAVPAGGDMFKIVPAAEARQVPGSPLTASEAPFDDVVTQVIEVRNVPAAQLVPLLRPLVPQYGHLAAYPGSNVIIISDRAANVSRLIEIIRRVDQASDAEVEIIPLQHASASETVRVLTALSQNVQREAGSQPPTMVADDRTNSILISGDKSDRLRLRALITHLDTPLESGGNTQVVYLRYANAESLANILKGHVTETASKEGGEKAATDARGYSDVIILHEPDTNALVITAPQKVMRTLQNIIEKLDIRRAQVHVEGIIAEIAADKAAELGVTWALDSTSDDKGPAAITNFPNSGTGIAQIGAAAAGGDDASAAAGALLNAAGLSLGFGRVVAGQTSFVGLLRALSGNSATNILSTPSITTMDNEEAEIKVGQEIPFRTGQYTNTGTTGAVNPFQTIQRKEVGLSLKVTPQISDSDTIVLKIAQEASSLAQGVQGAADLVTNKRTITTSVVAENNEIIVLGGLIDDQVLEGEQRVPLLGSIPLLGELFRYRTSKAVKTNLMVFIKPSILRTADDASFYTGEKYRYIKDLQRGYRDGAVQLIPKASQPQLPDSIAPDNVAPPDETGTDSEN